jgi:hypothetical protein
VLRKTFIAAAAAAAALALATPALAAGGGGWQVTRLPGMGGGQSQIQQVTAAGPGSQWAFGEVSSGAEVAFERTGSTWSRMTLPKGGVSVLVARAASATDVWAFASAGTGSQAMHWNGRSWSVAGRFGSAVDDAIVLGPGNVWAFAASAWHYNGRTWSQVAGGTGLTSGSALSPTSIWAGGGSEVAHWNGNSWTRTSVARLLPPRIPGNLNDPAVSAMYAQSADSVYAIADGNAQDAGGPIYVLHWNGRAWSKVASYGGDYTGPAQVTGDGSGGLWLAGQGGGNPSVLLHYSGGHLTKVGLPSKGLVLGLSRIPGTQDLIAPMSSSSAQLILEYKP